MKGPIGRIGTPINNRTYRKFLVEDVTVFIEKSLLDELPAAGGWIDVLMGDYGTWRLRVGCAEESSTPEKQKDR